MNSINSKAPMGSCSSPSGLSKDVSKTNYSTTTPPVNKEETKALELLRTSGYEAVAKTFYRLLLQKWAETQALKLLQQDGWEYLQQIDWLGKKDGKWIPVEVKGKELFEPGTNFPHWGIGLNKSQVWLRAQLSSDLGWPIYLINFVPETDKIYGAYLDELENKGGYYNTSGIRIYPLEHYQAINNAPNQNLGGRLN